VRSDSIHHRKETSKAESRKGRIGLERKLRAGSQRKQGKKEGWIMRNEGTERRESWSVMGFEIAFLSYFNKAL
jgi:hypothetical protein